MREIGTPFVGTGFIGSVPTENSNLSNRMELRDSFDSPSNFAIQIRIGGFKIYPRRSHCDIKNGNI